MQKILKSEVVKLMSALKAKFSNEELAVMIDRSSQTLWSWGQEKNKRVPCKSDYEVLRRLAAK